MIYSLSLHVVVYNVKGGGKEIYTPWHNSVGLEKEHLFDLPIQ